MRIGVPKEIKVQEYRVGAQPAGVRQLVAAGHEVRVETGAGLGSGFKDEDYVAAGASIVDGAAAAWDADMVVKVKEPIAPEFRFFRKELVVYTYLHLAAAPELTKAMLDSGVRGVAYETITDDAGTLPLLRPMSEIAGRMSVQVGVSCLQKENGGKGLLLGGVPGTRRGRVTVIGGGVVGMAAARIAIGMGAQVTVLDLDAERMNYLEDVFGNLIETLYSNPETIEETVRRSDMVVGAVLVPGAAAPKLVSKALIKEMQPGSVVVDVAVDQGGCIETCKPTTHENPTYMVDGVVHYCVANMPGAVPRTSTLALTNSTLRHAQAIAKHGIVGAVKANRHLAEGVNTWDGVCTNKPVADSLGLEFGPLSGLL